MTGRVPSGQALSASPTEPVPVSALSGDDPSRDITLPLMGVYFDQIVSGEKAEEYRLATPFWRKRIEGRAYRNIVLTRGYPKAGGIEGQTRLTLPWRGYSEKEIIHPHFGAAPVTVFAIQVAQ